MKSKAIKKSVLGGRNNPTYQGYFFSLLAEHMDTYLGLLGPELEEQRQYLGEQLQRIVTGSEDQLVIAGAVINYLARGRAKVSVDNLSSLASWLDEHKKGREFLLYFDGEDSDDFLQQAVRRAIEALTHRTQTVKFNFDEFFESYTGSAINSLMSANLYKVSYEIADSFLEPPKLTGPSASPVPRYLYARTKEQLRPNEEFGLTVQVTLKPGDQGPAEQATPFPDIEGDISINVHGNGVEFIDSSIQTLHVPAKGESAPILFRLKAVEPGEHRLEITAWKGAAHIAGMTLTIRVDATALAADGLTVQTTPVAMRQPVPGEYTLLIHFQAAQQTYNFRLLGEDLGDGIEAAGIPLTDSRRAQYEGLRNSLNAQARNESGYDSLQQSFWLKGFGKNFADCVVPPIIQSTLRRIRGKIRQLTIMNDGDDLPWELLYIDNPDAADVEGFFIAELPGACRWRFGAPPPAKIIAIPSILVHPEGSPAYTADEITQLQQLFPSARIIETMKDLIVLIQEGQFGMLHFAAHNKDASGYDGGSYIPFGQTRFDQNLFTGAVRANAYRSSQPLIFMNACTSAGGSSLFTEVFSWADRYIRSGAGSFIGSLWEIADQSAPVFALAFYKTLKKGDTLGEAMQAGREAVRALDPGDPTRLAYTLYGNPQARVEYA
jgi:CHAT domain